MMNQFLQDLRQFIPSDRIYTDELRTLGWGTDASFYRQIPKVVIRSDGEEEISKIVKACQKYKLPFTFRAAGTSLSGQSCTESVLIVAGKHWEKYEIGENRDTIKLQPGIVGAKVNEILKPFGRVFPPDPASIGSAMVGGIVINNASGMNCGVHANSDRMMVSARIILTDGTVLDTGSEESKEAFRKSHPEFLKKIEALRDKVRADEALASRIRTKYSIKNVTGLNLRPLIAYDDPFDIIAHSMVGSEGTLAFLSEVTMKTLYDYKFKASAMVYFLTMKESCEAVVAMKKLKACSTICRLTPSMIPCSCSIRRMWMPVRSKVWSLVTTITLRPSSLRRRVLPTSNCFRRSRRSKPAWGSSVFIFLLSLRRIQPSMANTGPSAQVSSLAWVVRVPSALPASSRMWHSLSRVCQRLP